jgi:hypothetical protein
MAVIEDVPLEVFVQGLRRPGIRSKLFDLPKRPNGILWLCTPRLCTAATPPRKKRRTVDREVSEILCLRHI